MKNPVYAFILIPFLFSCNVHKEILAKGLSFENFRGFVPVDPIEYDKQVQIVENGKIISKEIKLLNHDEKLQFLNNETVLVSIVKVNAEGGVSYSPILISSKNSSYKVTMDYMKFATLAQGDDDGKFIGFNRVAVGLRLITLLTTNDAGINIGDLSSIGVAAKLGKLKGTLMIEIVGIKSKEVTTLIPLPSEINQTTIQNAMQALATIKSKIYDSSTELYPQIMAIKPDSSVSNAKTHRIDGTGEPIGQLKNDALGNDLKLLVASNKFDDLSSSLTAKTLEDEAFSFLFARNLDSAIVKFKECDRIYPKYHNAFDIIRLLDSKKNSLSDINSVTWKELFSEILRNYSWKLSDKILQRLVVESKK